MKNDYEAIFFIHLKICEKNQRKIYFNGSIIYNFDFATNYISTVNLTKQMS